MARKVSTAQAAKELSVSPQHIARLIRGGKLEGQRIGERGWYRVTLPDKKEP